MTDPTSESEMLTDDELCEELKVNKRTTQRWRDDGEGPPYVRVGPRQIRYRRVDVTEWLAARTFPHRAAEIVAVPPISHTLDDATITGNQLRNPRKGSMRARTAAPRRGAEIVTA